MATTQAHRHTKKQDWQGLCDENFYQVAANKGAIMAPAKVTFVEALIYWLKKSNNCDA